MDAARPLCRLALAALSEGLVARRQQRKAVCTDLLPRVDDLEAINTDSLLSEQGAVPTGAPTGCGGFGAGPTGGASPTGGFGSGFSKN